MHGIHSPAQALFRKKDREQSGSVASLVLLAAPGCLRTRFSSILGQIWDGFSIFLGTISGGIFCIETRNVSAGVGTAPLFGAEFSHSLGKKCALTRTTHPQQPLSKGGGLAKRPQSAAPVAGVSGILIHT